MDFVIYRYSYYVVDPNVYRKLKDGGLNNEDE